MSVTIKKIKIGKMAATVNNRLHSVFFLVQQAKVFYKMKLG